MQTDSFIYTSCNAYSGMVSNGYDDLDLLREMTAEELNELAAACGMKPGFKLRFRKALQALDEE